MKHALYHIIIALTLLFAPLAKAGHEAAVMETDHAEVEIESDVSAIQAGVPFWLSLEFELEPHWHIYWKNPGDSGLAPQLRWTLPEGFTTEAIHWPTPERINVEGLVNYGYEGITRLLIPVIPPDELAADQRYEFALEASWLVCKDICIPESGKAAITLSVNPDKTPAFTDDAAGIRLTLESLPQLFNETADYQRINQQIELRLPLPDGKMKREAIKDAYFFAQEGGVTEPSAPQTFAFDDTHFTVTMKAGTQPIAKEGLGGVLVLTLDTGEKRAFQLTAQNTSVATNSDDTRAAESAQTDASLYAAPPMPSQSPLTAELASEPQTSTSNPAMPMADQQPFWQALFFAFLGGLLLNAMPCVFPVLSIKALAISKKAAISPLAVKKQGLAYLLGVVASFLVMGAMLILLKQSGEFVGWGFQLQSPAFITIMMYIFLLLGLSLSGMFELPMMFSSVGAEKAGEDSISGSFLTGILAVLVATPCTVPFMAPAVGYAFSQPSFITLIFMVALGVGLAFPYLLVSFFPPFRALLPKPGAWMIHFKELMAFFLYATVAWLVWVLSQQTTMDGFFIALQGGVVLALLIWFGKGKSAVMRISLFTLAIAMIAGSITYLEPVKDHHYKSQSHAKTITDLAIPYNAQSLMQLRAENKPVFVNATAAWCITCKVNERVALRASEIYDSFHTQNITYMVADWTNYDEPITRFLESYERQGVPLYVYFPGNGAQPVVLPQLLTKNRVLDVIGRVEPAK